MQAKMHAAIIHKSLYITYNYYIDKVHNTCTLYKTDTFKLTQIMTEKKSPLIFIILNNIHRMYCIVPIVE